MSDLSRDTDLAAVAWLESFINFEKKPVAAPYARREYSLAPFRALLASLGDPQDARPTIHIAGTKGKGTTAVFVDRLARAAGLLTGRYTSPHLESYRERIALGGEPVDAATFERTFAALRAHVEARGMPREREFRSLFELMTAGAWMLFREREVGCAVLECGLGGRLDATNCVAAPRAAVVTSIGYDHVDLLGPTIDAIAREKAGIFKAGRPAVVRRQVHPEAAAIWGALRERAEAVGAPLVRAEEWWQVEAAGTAPDDPRAPVAVSIARRGRSLGTFELGVRGAHQRGNLEAALAGFEASGLGPTREEDVANGRGDDDAWRELLHAARLGDVRHGGRLEILSTRPLIVADGAHCPLSMRALVAALPEAFPRVRRWHVAFGCLATKDPAQLVRTLAECERVVSIAPLPVNDVRALPLEELREIVQRVSGEKFEAISAPNGRTADGESMLMHLASQLVDEPGDALLITGSLFHVGPTRRALGGAARAG